MAGLLYYISKHSDAISLKKLGELGLGYAFERTVSKRGVHRGPDGEGGVIIADGESVRRVGYYPEEQTWRRIPRTDAWVGLYTDDRPKPEELARTDAMPGHPVVLGDGQTWIAPVVRAWVEDGEEIVYDQRVPSIADVDDDGNWRLDRIVPAYEAVWDAACAWLDAHLLATTEEAGEGRRLVVRTKADLLDLAMTGLATNYRVGRVEAGLLGLLDERVAVQVCDAMIDWPTYVAWEKKKRAADGSSSSDGPVDSTGDTDQASPT